MPDYLNKNLLIPDFGTANSIGGMNQNMMPQEDPKMPKNVPGISEDDDITKIVMKLYPQNHEVSDKFNEIWSQMPQRQKPSVLRRIVASMVGAGQGVKAADEVVNAPYNQAMGDWETKLKTLQPSLTDERAGNINQRLLAQNAAAQQRDERKQTEVERKNQATESINRDKLKVQQDRAKAYIFKQNNPNHIIKEDAEGNLIGINPANDSMQYIVDDDGNKIKTSTLSDADKINLQVQGRIAAARVSGEEARKTENVRQTGRESLEDKRAAGRVALEEKKIQGRKEVVSEKKNAQGEVTSRTTTVYDDAGNVVGSRTENFTKKPIAAENIPGNVTKIRMITPPDKDGKTREIMVPADKVAEAIQRGAKRK